MFLFHIGFSLELLALVAGAALYIWAIRNTGAGTCFAKTIGLLTVVLAVICLVCSSYCNMKFWREYNVNGPMGMHSMQIQDMETAAKHSEKNKKHER